MLPKKIRFDVRSHPDFFEHAKSLRARFFTVLYTESEPASAVSSHSTPSPAPFQFAVVVKKTVASGVERTEIKRRVRSAITSALSSPLPDFDTSYAVVVIPRRSALNASHEELASDLISALSSLPHSAGKTN